MGINNKNKLYMKILLPAAILFSIAAASCQKCVTCEYSYKRNLKDTTITRSQVCGNRTEIDNEEKAAKAASARDGAADVACTKN